MQCRVFCNLADSSNVKTSLEIIIFKDKTNYTHLAIQLQVFWRKQKKLGLFSRNKKHKALIQVKQNRLMPYKLRLW